MNKINYLWITLCCTTLLCGCAGKDDYIPMESENISTMIFEEIEKTEGEASEVISEEIILLPQPGMVTMENLLQTALVPVGKTMYVWGGGWNEEDTGAGVEAMSFGVSARWEAFSAQQTSEYDYKKTEYQIHDGLDCSGYIGWLIYNVFETEGSTMSEDGYVYTSTQMAEKFAAKGWGEYLTENITQWKPGDICSMPGHVWMSLGMCEDGSVLLVHASPPGVRLSGTRLSNGEESEAVKLAEEYMKKEHPEWYEKYPACDVSYNYLTKSNVFRWNSSIMKDENRIQEMSAKEIVEIIQR